MCTFIQTNWQMILALIVGICALLKYFDTRKRELAWRRTEFIFEQARLLDTDLDLSDAILILEERHTEVKLSDLFAADKNPYNSSLHSQYYQKMDKLLNFLDRLAYATLDARTLSLAEVVNFGWYFKKIDAHQKLKEYCMDNGFNDILILANKIMESNTRQNWVRK